MKHNASAVVCVYVLASILILAAAPAAADSASYSEALTAYDVSWYNGGAVAALGSKLIYISEGVISVITPEVHDVVIYSAVLLDHGYKIVVAGSYGTHPLLGVVDLSGKEAKFSAYVGYFINGSFLKVRLIDDYIYCTGYLVSENTYEGIVLAVSREKLLGGKSDLECRVASITCGSSCYIRDIIKLSSSELMLIGAHYSTGFYPKYQLLMVFLDKQFKPILSYLVESENSLRPKGIYVLENNAILCIGSADYGVFFLEFNSQEVSSKGEVTVKLFLPGSRLLSVVATGGSRAVYLLARTSGPQYVIEVRPESAPVITELTIHDPIAIILRNDVPTILTSEYRLVDLVGVAHTLQKLDIEHSKLRTPICEMRVTDIKLTSSNLKVKTTTLDIVHGGEEEQNTPVSHSTAPCSKSAGISNGVGEIFKKDVSKWVEHDYIILAASLILIVTYLVMRSRVRRLHT